MWHCSSSPQNNQEKQLVHSNVQGKKEMGQGWLGWQGARMARMARTTRMARSYDGVLDLNRAGKASSVGR